MAKIVVADDDADIRTMVGYRLQRAGHEVIAVADGAAALDACREHAPDLAVLDLMMPGLGGLDAARQIRADSGLRDVPDPHADGACPGVRHRAGLLRRR